MKYTLLRNATAVIDFGGKRLLVDPALDPAEHRPPVRNTANQVRNPLIDLPDGWETFVSDVDGLLVTHLHQDHFDETAIETIPKSLPIFGQPVDIDQLVGSGFENVRPVGDSLQWDGLTIIRTPAQHGTGAIATAMAPVCGFVLQAVDEPTVYTVGDSIWYEGVAQTIALHKPDVIVVNASGASFLESGPIVMNAADIASVQDAAPDATIVVVHLEAINHCHETRAYYRQHLPTLGLVMETILIPEDGESIAITARA